MKRAILGAFLVMVAVIAAPPGAAMAATAGVWQWWTYPSSAKGYYNADQTVQVNQTGSTRFFAHQVAFKGGDGAYIGLQDTPAGRIAIFSVWNSPGRAVPGVKGSKCTAFGGEGNGWSCRIPYAWKVGSQYRLRFWTTQTNAAGEVQWIGTIQELPSGKDTAVGYLWSRAKQGWIASSVSWIEDYSVNSDGTRCRTEKTAAASFTAPHLNNNSTYASLGNSQTATCGGTSHRSAIRRVPSRPASTSAVLTQ